MAKTTLEVSIVVAHLHEQLVAGWCRTQIVGFSLASFSGEEGTSDVVCCNPPRRGNIVKTEKGGGGGVGVAFTLLDTS